MAGNPAFLGRDLKGLSLRANFSWTFCGNVANAGMQWALVLLMARLFAPEVFGRFALALGVVTPIFTASGLQLRAVLVSDALERTPFVRYLSLRLVTSVLALSISVLIAILGRFSSQLFWMVFFLGLGQAAIMVKDIFHGVMQRRERMDRAAISLVLQGLLTLASAIALFGLFRNAVVITAGMAAGRVLVLILYDIPCARSLSNPGSPHFPRRDIFNRLHFPDLFSLARLAFPLGVVTLFISLYPQIPRYFLAGAGGERAVGFFAALASFMALEEVVSSALGQSAAHRLSVLCSTDLAGFRSLLGRLALAGFLTGLAGLLAVLLWGQEILQLFFREEYAQFARVFAWLMLAQLVVNLTSALGYGMTAARKFRPQVCVYGCMSACLAAACWLLVPRFYGLGAAWAMLVAASTGLVGAAWVLRGELFSGRVTP